MDQITGRFSIDICLTKSPLMKEKPYHWILYLHTALLLVCGIDTKIDKSDIRLKEGDSATPEDAWKEAYEYYTTYLNK